MINLGRRLFTKTFFPIQGQPVAVLHGANAPLLQKMIEKEIELERKVLKGDIDREVISFEEAVPVDSKFYRKCLSDYIPLSKLIQTKYNELISIKYCPKRGHFFQGDLDIFHSAIRRIKNKPYNVVCRELRCGPSIGCCW